MSDANDWNTQIIEEFRANGGQVGGQFAGAPLLLLHTTGARSGDERDYPGFADYESKTSREIPVVVLDPA